MKKLIAVFLMLGCTACAPVTTKVNVPDIAKSDSLSVSDMRPASEKDKKIFSLLITSKEYGIIRAGDATLSPPPARLLQHQVYEKFNVGGQLPKVVVYHFVIYENLKSQFRSGAIGGAIGGMVGGLVGNALASHDAMAQTELVNEQVFDGSSNDGYQRGLYTDTENPKKASVYIVYIDTDIDGKRVLTRTVAPIMKHGDQDSLVNAVQLAIKNHLADYGASAMQASASATPASTTEATPRPMPATVDADPATATESSSAPSTFPATAAATAPATATVASTSLPASSSGVAITSMAQAAATQMGCGAVQANGDSTFVAPCGTYGVLIDCEGDHCRPMHTVPIKGNE